MVQCASVKKRGSKDPCTSTALVGHSLCGRHARMKDPELWVAVHPTPPITKFQALARGWLVRNRLSHAGFGVLSRKGLANDEDIISFTEKERVHPMDYISFEENGKHWWFEFGSLWTWCMRNYTPVNPYTKVPLKAETRKRLRTIWGYKKRNLEPVPLESEVFIDRVRHRLNILTQHFADYGFVEVYPEHFIDFTRNDYKTMFILLNRDIETVIPASDPFRQRVAILCTNRAFTPNTFQKDTIFILQCLNTLLHIITLYRDPYTITFSILSVLYRC